MSTKAAVCLTASRTQAESLVSRLHSSGFSYGDISVLLPDSTGGHEVGHEKSTKAPEGAAAGAGTGGIVGGTLGLLVGIGSLAIPGLGPFIAAGPILAALSGAAVGATVGGVTGALVGMGMPEYEAKAYDGQVRQGRVLVSVHAEDSKDLDRAKEIFEQEGAESIGVTGEKEASSR